MSCAIVPMKRTRAEVCGLDGLANYMGFPDPRPLCVRKNYRYEMTSFLQRFDKRVDVWRRLFRGRPIIIDNLVQDQDLVGGDLRLKLTRMCIFLCCWVELGLPDYGFGGTFCKSASTLSAAVAFCFDVVSHYSLVRSRSFTE